MKINRETKKKLKKKIGKEKRRRWRIEGERVKLKYKMSEEKETGGREDKKSWRFRMGKK